MARDNTTADIVILALVLTLVAPTLLFLIELVLVPAERARRAVHLLVVGMLVAAIALQAIKDIGGVGAHVLLALAAAIGAGGALAYARSSAVRTGLTVLSPAPVVLALLFLFTSPVSKLVLPQDVSSAAASVGGNTPVVFVMFDEFPSTMLMDSHGRLDSSRFPHYAALARDATWYRNATTVADLTPQAVSAALTGNLPEPGQLPVLADHPDNLFTLLEHRYAFHVQEPVTDLCPESICHEGESRDSLPDRLRALADDLSVVYAHRVVPESMEHRLPAVDQAFGGFRRQAGAAGAGADQVFAQLAFDDRRAKFEGFVSGIRPPGSKPDLHFIHIELPHIPAEYLPTGQQYAVTARDPPYNKERWTSVQAYQRHLLQVGFTDHLLGELISRLKRTGVYDRALIVVAADHGASYRQGEERRRLTSSNATDIAGIPLLIKAPRQSRGRTDLAPARSIDIVPTIADYLGSSLPWKADGRSLRRDPPPGRRLAVIPQRGRTVAFTPSEFVARHDRELARMSHLFAPGVAGLYSAGPAPELVGRRVGEVPSAGTTGLRARIDDPGRFASVDPGAKVLPAYITGRLDDAGAREHDVAVALNGRIAAVSHSYGASGEPKVSAMVAPERFRRGSNRLQLFEVLGTSGNRRLAPLERQSFRLERRGGRTYVVVSGRRFRVVAAL